jgi:exonuclease V gamma subunit
MDESLARIRPALAAWLAADGGPPRTLPYTIEWDGLRLSGTLAHVYADGLRQFSPGRGHGRNLIALGVDVLAWSALGETQPVLRVLREGGQQRIAPMPAAQARAKLRQLLALATRARREPLPFMPKAGAELVCAEDEAEGLAEARKAWLNPRGGEGQDAWVRLALRGAMPFEDAQATAALAALAHAIFLGIPGGLPCEDGEGFDVD